MIQEVDHDKSGLVDFNEFLSLMANKKSSKRQESFELMHAFKAFDRVSLIIYYFDCKSKLKLHNVFILEVFLLY